MADEIDRANDVAEILRKIAEDRARSAKVPVGEPGECIECGYTFTRLVNHLCGKCRDDLGRP